jgi:hypothetical protein
VLKKWICKCRKACPISADRTPDEPSPAFREGVYTPKAGVFLNRAGAHLRKRAGRAAEDFFDIMILLSESMDGMDIALQRAIKPFISRLYP